MGPEMSPLVSCVRSERANAAGTPEADASVTAWPRGAGRKLPNSTHLCSPWAS